MKLDNVNTTNTFVIGDVHGCYFTLQNLVRQFPQDAKLIFVGDLCDKGKYSNEVIEYVITNKHLCVKGNHEHLFEKYILDACEKGIHSPWSDDKRYGGMQTIRSYNGDIQRIKKHLKWIEKLPIYIEISKFFITHGFALEFYGSKDKKESYNNFLLNRLYENSVEPQIDKDIINIFGHCIFQEVQKGKKYICLDTGCAKGGKLSAYSLEDGKVYEEFLDTRDSDYSIKELLLKDISLDNFSLDELSKITLKKDCKYASFDVVSDEVLGKIVEMFPHTAKELIYLMKERSVIFPKQFNRFLEKLI